MAKSHPILHGLHALPHWLHWVASIGSFVGLLSIGFAHATDGKIVVTLTPRFHEVRLMEQGIYALIFISVLSLFAYHWIHYWFYKNQIAISMNDVEDAAVVWGSRTYVEGEDEFVLTPVTIEDLQLFLDHVERAYPSGIRSNMTSPEREETYRKWIRSGKHAGVNFVKKRRAGSAVEGRIVGFSACVMLCLYPLALQMIMML